MKQTRLRSRVCFDLHRVVVLPADVDSSGYPHDGCCAIGSALLTAGLVLGRIPAIGHLAACWSEWHTVVVALWRRDHPETPVFSDNGGPVPGKVDRCAGSSRTLPALPSTLPTAASSASATALREYIGRDPQQDGKYCERG